MQDLRDRVAVITGAASGIGLAMAKLFAQEGMKLVLADIEPAPLAKALDQVRAIGAQAIAVPVDVASEAQVNALADAAFKEFGAVHVLCNNAGVAVAGLTSTDWAAPIADWHWVLGVNLMGVVHGLRAFLPRMLAAGHEGHVVNTASVAGLLTAANPYHVSKHGVTCITEGLYKDLKRTGSKISASVLCPGLIRTEILSAERNRPAEFGPATAIEQRPESVQKAASDFAGMLQAGYVASHVAQQVLDAIRADRFYVVPAQPFLVDLIETRMQDIVAQRNPTLPPSPGVAVPGNP